MQDLGERIVQVLGKSIQDFEFGQFMEDLGERPDSFSPCLSFSERGFLFVIRWGLIYSACMYVRIDEPGLLKSYTGPLPFGIGLDDKRRDVEKRFGNKLIKTGPYAVSEDTPGQIRCSYAITPYTVTIIWDLARKRESLASLLVTLDGAGAPPDADSEGQSIRTRIGRARRPRHWRHSK